MTIWQDRNKEGEDFTCQGKDQSDVCHRHDLGAVGDNEASSIRCTCPREFDFVEYDIQPQDWELDVIENNGIVIDQVRVRNPCYAGGCPPQESLSSQANF